MNRPKLRFPEFRDDGDWIKISLVSTADKKVKWSFTGGPFGSNLKISDYTEGGLRIIQLQNIGEGEFNDDSKIFTSVEKADELLSCNIYAGDIILSKMGDPVGRACIIPNHLERCVMASDGIRLAVDEKKYSKYFIFSLINSKPIRKAIENKSTGSTRKRIGLNDLKEVQLTVPKNPQEQQKIASCLSALDKLIHASTEKLSLLKDHKKGLLQQLFPAEGETLPQLRFPEFKDDGEWVEREFHQVGEFIGGGTPSTSNSEYWDGNIQWYTPTEVKNGILKPSLRTITKLGLRKSAAKLLPIGAILITTRATIGDVAITEKECTTNQGFQSLVVNDTEANVFWLYWIIRFKNELIKRCSGSTFKEIGKTEIKNIPTFSPPSKEEQQKIASCLSAADELITAQTQKIAQLQDHKKGMMQQLFPDVEVMGDTMPK